MELNDDWSACILGQFTLIVMAIEALLGPAIGLNIRGKRKLCALDGRSTPDTSVTVGSLVTIVAELSPSKRRC
jgi:hypothetical protein